MAGDGTWDRIPATLTAAAAGLVDWSLSVDSSIARAHQHATNVTRHTGGWIAALVDLAQSKPGEPTAVS